MLRCVLLAVLLYVLSSAACPYHQRLERIRQQQRQQEREFKRRFGLFREGYTPPAATTFTPPVDANLPHINLSPEVEETSSRQEYYVSSNPNRQQTLIGNNYMTVQQSDYVSCPNSNYYFCPPNTRCIREQGRYVCRLLTPPTGGCGTGLRRVDVSEYQYRCVDIDECADNSTNDCDQRCRNYFGGYMCYCEFGYEMNDERCEDMNECTNRQHRCQHECVNTDGSYSCLCPSGYEMINNYYCRDVDECRTDVCSEEEECLNLYGGYECNSPSECEEGYHRANSTSGLKLGPCVVDKYDGPNVPISISENRFALQRNYPAYREVGKLRYTNVPGHQYYFRVTEGNSYFQVIQNYNYISIRTKRALNTPGPVSVKIEITDISYSYQNYQRLTTKSRVDITFVVSQYSF